VAVISELLFKNVLCQATALMDASFLLWGAKLSPRAVYMRFVVDKVISISTASHRSAYPNNNLPQPLRCATGLTIWHVITSSVHIWGFCY